jgi:dihydroorotase
MFHRNTPPRVVPGKVAYVNARLMDPASGLDVVCGADGGLLTDGETISAYGPGIFANGLPERCTQVDCGGAILAPGLVDMRMQLREPGEAHKESVKSAGKAAVAGGITAMVTLPNTTPALDDEATIEFIARRARQIGLAKVYCYATTTKGAKGKELSEMGMLSRAGAVAFTDGDHAVADVQTMRRALQYAATFGALIIQHPEEPGLAGGVMNSGDIATRLGLSGIPREAEIIMLERDMRLVEDWTSPATPHRPTLPSTSWRWVTTVPLASCRRRCAPKATAKRSSKAWWMAPLTPLPRTTRRRIPMPSACPLRRPPLVGSA